MRILFIGDIMGRPGREAAAREIPRLKEEYGGFDFIIANSIIKINHAYNIKYAWFIFFAFVMGKKAFFSK